MRPYPLISKDHRENGQRGWDMTSQHRSEVKTRPPEKIGGMTTEMSEGIHVEFASLILIIGWGMGALCAMLDLTIPESFAF